MNPRRDFLSERYAQLWNGAIDFVRGGAVNVDPLLAIREPDLRRCLTVIVRPDAETREAVAVFLDQLRDLDPEQYYYDPSELHVTVLSLFTATPDFQKYLVRYDEYLGAVRAALSQGRSFSIEFTGVTLTRDAIMIQGYPDSSILNDVRETLRKELRARGLTDGLDARYVLQTAHMTVVRFRNSLRNSGLFAQIMENYRGQGFGQTKVSEVHLVHNDWYMSRSSVKILDQYQLSSNSTPKVSQPL